jgi:transposase
MSDTPLSILPVRLGPLPMVKQVVNKLGIGSTLLSHVKHDPRDKMLVSDTLIITLLNVITERFPLYKMGEWALQKGLISSEATDCFTDDRVGRALDRLFFSDRAAITTAIVLKAINTFGVEINRVHNDSTSVTLFGDYAGYLKTKAAKPAHGHNKDFRPDLKQLVFSLSVTDDGAVPLFFKVWDGNTTDDSTHIRNWMSLRCLIGHPHFIYIADSKLCVRESMQHIHAEGGSFVTVMPETRQEIARFRIWLNDNTPQWQEALRLPNTRKKHGPPRVFSTYDSPFLSSEGYRIIWIKSLDKQRDDELRRTSRIQRTEDILLPLNHQVHGNRKKLECKVLAALQENQTADYFDWQIVTDVEESFKQHAPGRPSATTTFRKIEKEIYRLTWCQKADRIQQDARYDGIFPLISNRHEPARQILEYYKFQPHLEKRHEQLKSVYNVAPVFLKNPQRIEALLLLYFLGMLVCALIERTVRKEMEKRQISSIPIYPEGRPCKAPTADKLMDLFADVRLQHIYKKSKVIQTVPDNLTQTQRLVLGLIGLKPEVYFESS